MSTEFKNKPIKNFTMKKNMEHYCSDNTCTSCRSIPVHKNKKFVYYNFKNNWNTLFIPLLDLPQIKSVRIWILGLIRNIINNPTLIESCAWNQSLIKAIIKLSPEVIKLQQAFSWVV